MKDVTVMWNELSNSLPDFVIAILILIVAFLISWIVKKSVLKLLKVLKVSKLFEKAKLDEEASNKVMEFIAKIVYLITFTLFLPGIFGKLGLSGVADPITSMMNVVLTYLPSIVAALIVLIIGLFISKLVKELLIPVFKKLRIDEWLEKLGFENDNKNKISKAEILANVVYALILIPVVIASLNILNIEAISIPATNMLNSIFAFIPNAVVAIIIFFVGKFIAELACTIVENLLNSVGTDNLLEKIIDKKENKENKFSLSKTIAYIVKYVVLIFFIVQAIKLLKLDVLTNIGNAIIGYMPYAVSTIIVIGITLILANMAEKTILKNFPNSKATALIAKISIIVVGAFVSLYQLGIAATMVNAAFIIILSAIAVAFAISFGVGGREFASHTLQKLEKKIDKNDNK